tara:strand:+ start:81863 stop:83239 length:1377 start_codon:yes stop_codon:yes gene_type:complete
MPTFHPSLLIGLTVCLCSNAGFATAQDAAVATSPRIKFALPAEDADIPGAGPLRRHEWFQNRWTERREKFAKAAAQDKGAVVFLGDSITQGWTDDFRGVFAGMKVANRGIGGDTTRGMLLRLEEDVLSLDPAAVVMLMGTNDLEENAEPKTIAGNVELIIERLKKSDPKMPIVLCQMFPSSAEKNRPKEKIQETNRLCSRVVKGDPLVTVVDTWTLFAGPDGDANDVDFKDKLHINPGGYAKWAAALRPIFATLGFLETDAEPLELEPGFVSLFNGKDLSGWGFRKSPEKMIKGRERWLKRDPENAPTFPIVTEPVTFDGKTSTPGGRYVAKAGRLIVTTPPEGRKIQQLYTTAEFPNDFELRLEFRATPNADSGVFIREPQLQCRDFVLAGPYKDLKHYKPQQWNELVVTVKGNVAHCTCNGEVIEDALKVPDTGPIGLEGDRGQIEYRHIRIKTQD